MLRNDSGGSVIAVRVFVVVMLETPRKQRKERKKDKQEMRNFEKSIADIRLVLCSLQTCLDVLHKHRALS